MTRTPPKKGAAWAWPTCKQEWQSKNLTTFQEEGGMRKGKGRKQTEAAAADTRSKGTE